MKDLIVALSHYLPDLSLTYMQYPMQMWVPFVSLLSTHKVLRQLYMNYTFISEVLTAANKLHPTDSVQSCAHILYPHSHL